MRNQQAPPRIVKIAICEANITHFFRRTRRDDDDMKNLVMRRDCSPASGRGSLDRSGLPRSAQSSPGPRHRQTGSLRSPQTSLSMAAVACRAATRGSSPRSSWACALQSRLSALREYLLGGVALLVVLLARYSPRPRVGTWMALGLCEMRFCFRMAF